ncbi:gliding motility-associated C-terminal domain-containing protein [Belliella kenyensis]|uniref:Gliding motility-associated C-terminal domain-containing protein n=1 Tax=Belliella kenyensis TaxID=1472724 RepID=A0ABV8EKY9_9BACT|nr:gliding motility-associated C-terminal domain-containing protein [Belliella kenyensis]MCH7400552.1 gliding motility-associated C-terminal domain-containing protein [Belliella kenyensis]MDN3602161.1 gliding motility-associated C-terminal domain-containing protein [Belliella kenyensis]
MKSLLNNIKFLKFFREIGLIFCLLLPFASFSQGVNNNEWIFGYCGASESNNYLSFGRGGEPIVRTLSGAILVGENNNAVAVDPLSGNIIFYSNGELIYNYDNAPIQGAPNGINGNSNSRQQVAIGLLDYEPDGDRLFYTFYISSAGQLQYAVIDMNASGQAIANQPPLGEVTVFDQVIGPASGAIAVVKSAQSPSYLISFSGGSLISRRIEDTQGDFTNTDDINISFTPKAIIFNEETGQMILIPEENEENLIVIDFDTSGGTFGAVSAISQSAGVDPIEGVSYSPDGAFIYFSRGDQLFRIPTSDLDAAPTLIPIENDVFRIYDVKLGPDGRLYYIYEEVEGGPQLLGRVDNPNEEELEELEINEDPFNGVDFCGRVFPQFAPNADIDAQVNFTWQPEEPCSNNPVQLTSNITPQNYRPISFEWSFDPELTDEDGEPIDVDFNQEHLLLPAEATSGESVTATLVVTFADGTTREVTNTITLSPNDLQANFTPQDTTLCEPCLDLMPLLEAQQGGGQDGGQGPGVGGPGGGGGGEFEYFWSNKRDEGWGPEAANEVCDPGLYWVLVREQGSTCYAYATIRIRIWGEEDQSNNIWYFGDGAGMDFNPDPDDPDGPMPRPVTHPQNIPAGTTTISDETGQVLFYTDGSTVWDLNGNVMQNGQDIGGSNQASEGVIAIPIPQEETMFYLFTTSTAADGGSQVKYSLVDIKAENPTGVGNVVTKDNFLFSPATQHSAALTAGDNTWVLFHELGNNTFRAYQVGALGIGSPVFSSVGSTHGFNTGVGSMKFSPDGTKIAVTIQDGACSRLELFDFDQSSGQLTEYALLDLGCNNDAIYGVEFSNDSDRVYVSYTGNGGRVEEFIIQSPSSEDEGDDCGSCLENANSSAERAACIIDSRNDLGINGPIGAIQMGPLGDIYVARPGQSYLGTIRPGSNCASSIGTTEGFLLAPGTSSNLGLPSFVQQSGSSIPEPAISGPDQLCLDPENGAEGLFEGAGEPDIDSYFWTVVHEDGEVEQDNFGGPGEDFQNYTHIFQRGGLYTVTLVVDRCTEEGYYNEENSIQVRVIAPPPITLESNVILCVGNPVTLTAIDGYDPVEGLYDFDWRNAAGFQIGDENSNSIIVEEESIYTVTVSFRRPEGIADEEEFDSCSAVGSIFVGPAFEFELTQSTDEVCFDGTTVLFAPDTPIAGEWFYQRAGDPERVPFPVGQAFELEVQPSSDLPSPGQYEIIFVTEDPIVEGCLIEKILELEVFPRPDFEIVLLIPETECGVDEGSFEVTVLVDLSTIEIVELGVLFTDISANEVLPVFENLPPGNYTIRGRTPFGCQFSRTISIMNTNPIEALENVTLSSTDETCGDNEILPGTITITLENEPTENFSYSITRQGDGLNLTGEIEGQVTVITGVRGGRYEVQVEDENGCAVPVGGIVVERRLLADFYIPSSVIGCEAFELTVFTQQDLIFSVTDPSGVSLSPDSEGVYLLTESGEYTVLGEDPTGEICSSERRVNVIINDAILFELSDPQVDCNTGVAYEALLDGTDASEVFFIWRNFDGAVVGRGQIFSPIAPGEYSLDVQPRIGSNCPTPVISFTVEDFENSLEYELEVLPFCSEDVFTLITLNGDFENISISWYRIIGSDRMQLTEFDDQLEITVLEDGVYEVEIRNSFDCIIGSEQISIRQSDIEAPVLEPSYTICELENILQEIVAGQYESYAWYIEGEEGPLSVEPTFTPTQAGSYRLVVFDEIGCEEEVTFEVVDDCDITIRFPNAMIPSDPSKQFVVYTSDFVDELAVFIYNRWGELIFYCEETNLPGDTTTGYCPWDGKVNGVSVPIGTYPVVVRFRSNNQNVTKTLKDAILVIE